MLKLKDENTLPIVCPGIANNIPDDHWFGLAGFGGCGLWPAVHFIIISAAMGEMDKTERVGEWCPFFHRDIRSGQFIAPVCF